MSFVLRCPNCGPREVTDFGYGGEVVARPRERPSLRELGAYNHVRRNVAGVSRDRLAVEREADRRGPVDQLARLRRDARHVGSPVQSTVLVRVSRSAWNH